MIYRSEQGIDRRLKRMDRHIPRSGFGKEGLNAVKQRSCRVAELVDARRNLSGKLSHRSGDGVDLGRSVLDELVKPLETGVGIGQGTVPIG